METARAYLHLIQRDPFLAPMLASYDHAACHACGKEVLDFGCGYGWGSYMLSPHCHAVTGFDPDLERIRFARQTFCTENVDLQWDIRSLAGRTYDMVCLFMVLPHASDPAGLLRQAGSFLKPGGTMWISFRSGKKRPKDCLPDAKGPKGRDIPALLGQWAIGSGFTRVSSEQRFLSPVENLEEHVYHKDIRA